MDNKYNMVCGSSASGIFMKFRGRVGDSLLVGSGFYVDNEAGYAAAIGVGEEIMKGCISYSAVDIMRRGCLLQKAAEEAVRRTHRRLAKNQDEVVVISIVYIDNQGSFGMATNLLKFDCVIGLVETNVTVYSIERVEGI